MRYLRLALAAVLLSVPVVQLEAGNSGAPMTIDSLTGTWLGSCRLRGICMRLELDQYGKGTLATQFNSTPVALYEVTDTHFNNLAVTFSLAPDGKAESATLTGYVRTIAGKSGMELSFKEARWSRPYHSGFEKEETILGIINSLTEASRQGHVSVGH